MPVWCVSSWEGSSAPVWCVSSWEGVVCASVACFQLGGGRLCQCGVFPAGRGSSVEGVGLCLGAGRGSSC